MKTDNRTIQQNRALFKFHEMVANTMNQSWISLNKLILEIEPRATKESLHIIFKEILLQMYGKNTSTKMTRVELNECLDVYMQALAMSWVVIDFPSADRQSLLNNF
jgi:hypothetical protein